MVGTHQESPNSARRGYAAACALIIGTIALVAVFPLAAPLGGVGLLTWGVAILRKPSDKVHRSVGAAAVCIGSLLILLTLGVLLTQFRVG